MGDRGRFNAVANFVLRHFPDCRRIADVAGGQGYLALALANAGKRVSVIDPRRTNLAKADRRRIARSGRDLFERHESPFDASRAADYDLIVGLHPDGATAEIARASLERPVVVVPCCNYWPGVTGDPAEALREFWIEQGISWNEERLPMTGKNLVLWTGSKGNSTTQIQSYGKGRIRPK